MTTADQPSSQSLAYQPTDNGNDDDDDDDDDDDYDDDFSGTSI